MAKVIVIENLEMFYKYMEENFGKNWIEYIDHSLVSSNDGFIKKTETKHKKVILTFPDGTKKTILFDLTPMKTKQEIKSVEFFPSVSYKKILCLE